MECVFFLIFLENGTYKYTPKRFQNEHTSVFILEFLKIAVKYTNNFHHKVITNVSYLCVCVVHIKSDG